MGRESEGLEELSQSSSVGCLVRQDIGSLPIQGSIPDELVTDTIGTDADDSCQHGDRVPRISFFLIRSLQGHAKHCLGNPAIIGDEVEPGVADVYHLVRPRRSAGPMIGNHSRHTTPDRLATIARSLNRGIEVGIEPVLKPRGQRVFFRGLWPRALWCSCRLCNFGHSSRGVCAAPPLFLPLFVSQFLPFN